MVDPNIVFANRQEDGICYDWLNYRLPWDLGEGLPTRLNLLLTALVWSGRSKKAKT